MRTIAIANGGGYTHGGVVETGSVSGFAPSGTETVRIIDEQLSIKLGRSSASVEVRYILKNTGKGTNVKFGFPLEELNESTEFLIEPDSIEPDKPMRNSLKYCRNYQIEIAGKSVPAKFETETESAKASDARRADLKGWLVSKTSFEAGEEKTMTIRYDAEYSYGAMSISSQGGISHKTFNYRLSTGACWEGPIEHGRIVIEADEIIPDEVTVIKPVNRFHKEGARWIWEFKDLEPTLEDDIVVEASPPADFYHGRTLDGKHNDSDRPSVSFIERNKQWFVIHSNYSVTASSTLPATESNNYSAENLRNHDKVWSEGAKGSGVGEWVNLKPEVPQPLRSIGILPGYVSEYKKELFAANARPRKLEVLLNGEFKFESDLEDRPETQEIPIVGYAKPVKEIRLTVKEVYEGTKFEDLCISQIELEARIKKKPVLEPTR